MNQLATPFKRAILSLLILAALTGLITACGGGGSDDPAPPAAPPAAPTIAAPTLAGAFQPGGAVTVTFTTTGTFNAGNVFTAHLSDGTGSFASRTAIGTGTSPIAATLPSGAMTGTAYRIRVVASNPSTISPDNGSNLSIAPPTIGITSIVSNQGSTNLIPGRNVQVANSVTGVFNAANVFTLQLSDASGSFSAPTALLTVNSPNLSSANAVNLPAGLVAGTGYRMRWVASSPAITGTQSAAFSVVIPSIGAPTTTGSNLTAGGVLAISGGTGIVTNGPFNTGCVFTLQLSDAAGSFASPRNLSTSTTTVLDPTSLSTAIPTNVPAGAGYRLRIVASNPVITGAETAPFAIAALPTLAFDEVAPDFSKMYIGSGSGSNHYRFRITKTGGDLNSGTSVFIQTPFAVADNFSATNLQSLVVLSSTDFNTLNSTGTVDISLPLGVITVPGSTTTARRFRVATTGTNNLHAGIFSSERQYIATQTAVSGGISATIDGFAGGVILQNALRTLGSNSNGDWNNQRIQFVASITGSLSGAFTGATLAQISVRVPLTAENIATGSQTVSVFIIYRFPPATGMTAFRDVFYSGDITASITGSAVSGYTLTANPAVTINISGSAPAGLTVPSSISLSNLSVPFLMQ